VHGHAIGLGVGKLRPALQGRRQQQKQAAAAQGTQGGAKAVRVEAAMGIVDDDIQLGAEQSVTAGCRQAPLRPICLRKPDQSIGRQARKRRLRGEQGPFFAARERQGRAMVGSGCPVPESEGELGNRASIRSGEGLDLGDCGF